MNFNNTALKLKLKCIFNLFYNKTYASILNRTCFFLQIDSQVGTYYLLLIIIRVCLLINIRLFNYNIQINKFYSQLHIPIGILNIYA